MPENLKARGERSSRASHLAERGPAYEIARRIRENGPVTFAEFMDVALYWPDGGYYTSGRGPWGEKGDYITSLDVSPAFASTLAKTVRETWEALGRPESFGLVEAGAGRGLLSKGIIDSIRSTEPLLHEIIKAMLVEKNPTLREPATDKVSWHGSLEEVPPFEYGCVLSNELIDSFPVHRVLYSGGLKEIYTDFNGEGFIDFIGEPSTPELQACFAVAGITLEEGQSTEVNLAAGPWISNASSLFRKGFVITIDYGLPARELYVPERAGTLLCHYRHTLNGNPYINIGEQDITTHVDFSGLALAGMKAGLELTGFTTQKNFLLGQGILEEMKESEDFTVENHEKMAFNRTLARLIAPGGMGDTFKVLVMHKGIDKPQLRGFSFKDMTRSLFR